MRVVDKVRHVATSSAPTLEYLKSQVSRRPHAQGHDPEPDDAALFAAGARHQPRGLPRGTSRTSRRRRARLRRRTARSLAAPAAPTCRWTTPTWPTSATRDARGGAPRRRSGTGCRTATKFINKVVAHKPAGMTLAMHLCRGNFKSTHAAAGNYRAGGRGAALRDEPRRLLHGVRRRPLRRLPPAALPAQGKIVVLGLVTTKFGALSRARTT